MERLRQAGICDFYGAEIAAGKPPDEAFRETMKFARCKNEKYIRGILNSPRNEITIREAVREKLGPLEKLERDMFDPLLPYDQRTKKAKRFVKLLERDNKYDASQKEIIKRRLQDRLAAKGIELPPSSSINPS